MRIDLGFHWLCKKVLKANIPKKNFKKMVFDPTFEVNSNLKMKSAQKSSE